jgi:hypothetical protein
MSNKTVFVIGAGASEEANLPTGYELKREIAQLLDFRFDKWRRELEYGDRKIFQALILYDARAENTSENINSYIDNARHIRDALPQAISIDHFIDSQRDNDKIALCGKLAIVRSIMQAERKSLLYFNKQNDFNINFNSLDEIWYLPFFQLITENCNKNDLKERFQSITLIIFNYDRCIEHFMYYALLNYYKLSKVEAAEMVNSINIYHPFGSVGLLPWQVNSSPMEFGAEPNPDQLLQLSKKIKTFTESTEPDSSEIRLIRKHVSCADRLVFIGFAFHPMNMQLIAPENKKDIDSTSIKCYATTYNISESDKEVISEQINELFQSKIYIRMINKKCCNFFSEFRRSLSF